MNEQEILNSIKNGNIDDFEKIIELYQNKVCNVIYQIIQNSDDVEDVAQEVFFKVYKNLNKFENKSSLYTWIYRITMNLCLDYIKKRKNHISIDEKLETSDGEIERQFSSDEKTHEQIIEENELKKILYKSIKKLPEKLRVMITLRDINEFSYEDIANFTNTKIGTVKSQINRAREKLKKILEENGTFMDYIESKDIER